MQIDEQRARSGLRVVGDEADARARLAQRALEAQVLVAGQGAAEGVPCPSRTLGVGGGTGRSERQRDA